MPNAVLPARCATHKNCEAVRWLATFGRIHDVPVKSTYSTSPRLPAVSRATITTSWSVALKISSITAPYQPPQLPTNAMSGSSNGAVCAGSRPNVLISGSIVSGNVAAATNSAGTVQHSRSGENVSVHGAARPTASIAVALPTSTPPCSPRKRHEPSASASPCSSELIASSTASAPARGASANTNICSMPPARSS